MTVSHKKRSWIVWLLPFPLSLGMGLGSLFGLVAVSDATSQEGPAGDVAGAAGALLMIICIGVTFIMATLTMIVARVVRRGLPGRIGLRIVLSIVGGGIVGALGATPEGQAAGAALIPLLIAPVLLSWTWRPKQSESAA